MPMLDLLMERHDAVLQCAQRMDARLYNSLRCVSLGGVIFSGIGMSTVSPVLGALTLAFGASTIHFDEKFGDAKKPGYMPSPGAFRKAESMRLGRQ